MAAELHPETLRGIIPRLAGKRVLVVGDLCLDEYLIGKAARLSREAPVPVLEFLRQLDVPGSAANPAINIRSLGGAASVAGVIGNDTGGGRLVARLKELGVETDGVVRDASRPTTVKTRLLAEVSLHFPQQIARLDTLDRRPLDPEIESLLIERLNAIAARVDAILVSDYRAGVVSARLIDAVRSSGAVLLTADSQGGLDKFAGFGAVKANQEETEAFLGVRFQSDEDAARAGCRLVRELDLGAALITRGRDGMTLALANGHVAHIPAANVSEVYDVTGAGDTAIATYTLAVAAGATPLQAVHLATHAAGLVVRRLGNAAPSPDELLISLGTGA